MSIDLRGTPYDPFRRWATAPFVPQHSIKSSRAPMQSAPFRAHLHRVMQLIKAFHGDLYGDVLFHAAAFTSAPHPAADFAVGFNQQPHPDTCIRCRVSPEYAMLFLSILRIDYMVQRVEHTGSYHLSFSDPDEGKRHLFAEIYITLLPRRDWCLSASDFDVDMLAMDTQRLYVRSGTQARLPSTSRLACTDPFMYLMDRVGSRKFSLIDGGRTLVNNQRAMHRAYRLLRDGWTMDDTTLGWNGWLVSHFGSLPVNRRACSSQVRRGHSSNDTCALCLDPFASQDIVVNLCCGHTFHYLCPVSGVPPTPAFPAGDESRRGLCAWLSGLHAAQGGAATESAPASDIGQQPMSGHNTCPYCRALI